MRHRSFLNQPVWGLVCAVALGILVAGCSKPEPLPPKADAPPDMEIAVKAAAAKNCGCGQGAAKRCEPCHGKNCYYCVTKALVAKDCGCEECGPQGCQSCGPGCDVCKFHLTPVEQAKTPSSEPKK